MTTSSPSDLFLFGCGFADIHPGVSFTIQMSQMGSYTACVLSAHLWAKCELSMKP